MLCITIDQGKHVTVTTDRDIPAGTEICKLYVAGNVPFVRVGIEAERFVQIARSDAKLKEQLSERQAGGGDGRA